MSKHAIFTISFMFADNIIRSRACRPSTAAARLQRHDTRWRQYGRATCPSFELEFACGIACEVLRKDGSVNFMTFICPRALILGHSL